MNFFGFFRCCTFVFKNNSKKLHKALTSVTRQVEVLQSSCLCTSAPLAHNKHSKIRGKEPVSMAESILKPQYFDYFLILDFESTCEENKQIHPQEIIEFPVLKINSKTLETEAIFHQYVQPRVHQELTPFCTKLTGIIQGMVDGQPHIEEVLEHFMMRYILYPQKTDYLYMGTSWIMKQSNSKIEKQRFDKWMADNNLLDENVKSLFVTCGDWDLMKMLPKQAEYFKLKPAAYFNKWLNIKKAYASVTSTYPKGMMPMLEGLNIPHQGRHHSGIDDCKNIGNILIELLRRGYVAQISGSR